MMDTNSTVETTKPDICSLSNPTEDSIVSALHMRFKRDLPYTRIGANNLIVVNSFQTVESLNDASLAQYANTIYRDLDIKTQAKLQPHIYDLAARVYYQLRRTSENQSIVLR
jgi:chitin synthase